jgi:hypothetical protein
VIRRASILIIGLVVLVGMVLPATALADDGGDDCETGWFSGCVFFYIDWDGKWDDEESGIGGCDFTAKRLWDGRERSGRTHDEGKFDFDTWSDCWEITVQPEQAWTPTCPPQWTCDSSGSHRFGIGQCGDEVPPVPEFPTYVLFGLGLVGVAGFVGFRRLRHERAAQSK